MGGRSGEFWGSPVSGGVSDEVDQASGVRAVHPRHIPEVSAVPAGWVDQAVSSRLLGPVCHQLAVASAVSYVPRSMCVSQLAPLCCLSPGTWHLPSQLVFAHSGPHSLYLLSLMGAHSGPHSLPCFPCWELSPCRLSPFNVCVEEQLMLQTFELTRNMATAFSRPSEAPAASPKAHQSGASTSTLTQTSAPAHSALSSSSATYAGAGALGPLQPGVGGRVPGEAPSSRVTSAAELAAEGQLESEEAVAILAALSAQKDEGLKAQDPGLALLVSPYQHAAGAPDLLGGGRAGGGTSPGGADVGRGFADVSRGFSDIGRSSGGDGPHGLVLPGACGGMLPLRKSTSASSLQHRGHGAADMLYIERLHVEPIAFTIR